MANIYLDVNILVDIVGKREFGVEKTIGKNNIVTSALSVHILTYVRKTKIPDNTVKKLVLGIEIVDFDKEIVRLALIGPTDDFEDNVQLYSAVEGGCDYFVTMDKKLLKMKYFGKMRICDKI